MMILRTGSSHCNFWSLVIYRNDEKILLAGKEITIKPKDLEEKTVSVSIGNCPRSCVNMCESSGDYKVVINESAWADYRLDQIEVIGARGIEFDDAPFDRLHILYSDNNGTRISKMLNSN